MIYNKCIYIDQLGINVFEKKEISNNSDDELIQQIISAAQNVDANNPASKELASKYVKNKSLNQEEYQKITNVFIRKHLIAFLIQKKLIGRTSSQTEEKQGEEQVILHKEIERTNQKEKTVQQTLTLVTQIDQAVEASYIQVMWEPIVKFTAMRETDKCKKFAVSAELRKDFLKLCARLNRVYGFPEVPAPETVDSFNIEDDFYSGFEVQICQDYLTYLLGSSDSELIEGLCFKHGANLPPHNPADTKIKTKSTSRYSRVRKAKE